MNEQEIRAKYQIRPLDNQIEFDRMMHELNDDQTKQNHPYLDRERELIKQRDMLMTQKKAIDIQMQQIHIERMDIEQKRKDINRVFHDIKHELIMANPRERFAKLKEESLERNDL